jgi:hypothetical protein
VNDDKPTSDDMEVAPQSSTEETAIAQQRQPSLSVWEDFQANGMHAADEMEPTLSRMREK